MAPFTPSERSSKGVRSTGAQEEDTGRVDYEERPLELGREGSYSRLGERGGGLGGGRGESGGTRRGSTLLRNELIE
jgi:hypothetical protein